MTRRPWDELELSDGPSEPLSWADALALYDGDVDRAARLMFPPTCTSYPKPKKGRGQRKARRDAAGREAHQQNLVLESWRRAARQPPTLTLAA